MVKAGAGKTHITTAVLPFDSTLLPRCYRDVSPHPGIAVVLIPVQLSSVDLNL